METAHALAVVGTELEHVEQLRALLEPLMGTVPAINCRIDIVLGPDHTVITVSDNEVVVQDQTNNRVTAQGDWDLARAALAGFVPPEPPPPEEP